MLFGYLVIGNMQLVIGSRQLVISRRQWKKDNLQLDRQSVHSVSGQSRVSGQSGVSRQTRIS